MLTLSVRRSHLWHKKWLKSAENRNIGSTHIYFVFLPPPDSAYSSSLLVYGLADDDDGNDGELRIRTYGRGGGKIFSLFFFRNAERFLRYVLFTMDEHTLISKCTFHQSSSSHYLPLSEKSSMKKSLLYAYSLNVLECCECESNKDWNWKSLSFALCSFDADFHIHSLRVVRSFVEISR